MSLYPNQDWIRDHRGDGASEENNKLPDAPAINERLPADMRRALACLIIDDIPAGSMYGDDSGITLKFRFFYLPNFLSYIRLAFTVRYLATPDDTELTRGEFYYYLYGLSVTGPITYRKIVAAEAGATAGESDPASSEPVTTSSEPDLASSESVPITSEIDDASIVADSTDPENGAGRSKTDVNETIPVPPWLHQLDKKTDIRLAAGVCWLVEIPRVANRSR